MTPLAALLRRRIAESGPLSVADYMAEVLGHPEHGYYATRDPLGVAGDFTTAPEISQVFGELIGAWCVEVWRAMDAPDAVLVVELGPGRGTLAADARRTWRQIAPAFAVVARLHLVETSPVLRARQQTALAAAATPRTWHTTLAEVPDGPMILLANEFFDALPIRQYVRRGDGWRERLVGMAPAGESFVFVDGPATDLPHDMNSPALDTADEGAILELCHPAEALAADIGSAAGGSWRRSTHRRLRPGAQRPRRDAAGGAQPPLRRPAGCAWPGRPVAPRRLPATARGG